MAGKWTRKMRLQQARRMRKLIRTGKIDVHKSHKKGPRVNDGTGGEPVLIQPDLHSTAQQESTFQTVQQYPDVPRHQHKAAVRDAYLTGVQDGTRLGWDQACVYRP